MAKRLVSMALWFTAVWLLYELAWSLAGIPRLPGPFIALAVSLFVGLDPLHRIWATAQRERRADSSRKAATFERLGTDVAS
ncbi:MAG TPA: hypothetical protein VIV06_02465 [Candidatus Limnocylindrales bacterium]